MERLHILDGYGYIFRAFYGLAGSGRGARLATAAGMPTGALYVFASMLIKLHREVKPERIAVVFDYPGKSFRKELYAEYKANRKETPADLKPQMPYFRQITEAFSWPTLSVEGVEADDTIASLVTCARAREWDVVVYSGDKDLLQLVDDRVQVHDSLRDITYDRSAVEKKFGVGPDKLRDFLALCGDTSDNVPGMPGVGKKTAAKLLDKYGSLDGILAHVGDFKGKQKERFSDPDNLRKLELSKLLVTLRTDVDFGVTLDDLKKRPWDSDTLEGLFHDLEFQVLLTRLSPVDHSAGAAGSSGSASGAEKSARGRRSGKASAPRRRLDPSDIPTPLTIGAADQLEPLIAAATAAGVVAVQVETDGRRPDRALVIGFSLAAPECAPVYVPLAHRYLGVPAQLAIGELPPALLDLLAGSECKVVCHDAKNTRRALSSIGVELAGIAADTMLGSYLLDPDRDVSVEKVLANTLAFKLPARKTLLGKGKNKIDFESVAVEQARDYSTSAIYGTLRARDEIDRRLKTAKLEPLMYDVELPLAVMLADMEQVGICLDLDYLRTLQSSVGADISALEKKVYALAGETINIGSPKQLSHLLFDKLGLKASKMRKTKTGYSTDHEVLESMLDSHEIIRPILDHRELLKLKGTYLDALPPQVNPTTRRIHTSFNQAVAATGRLSSENPNLQNIPIRTELGKKIRRAFVAASGKVLVSVDYSQIELRILAHLSEDPVLTTAFNNRVDVHTQTAAEVFAIAIDQVGTHERRVAKAVNYGLVYGQSEFGLARSLGISRTEAKKYITRYFQRLATVRTFLDGLVKQARKTGMVTTILGRRRPLADIGSNNYPRRQAAERMAKNTPMQGSAADLMKLAMLRVKRRMDESKFDAQMLLTVHDELIFEVAPTQADEFAAVVKDEMESAYELKVPLEVSVGMADNWAEAH